MYDVRWEIPNQNGDILYLQGPYECRHLLYYKQIEKEWITHYDHCMFTLVNCKIIYFSREFGAEWYFLKF